MVKEELKVVISAADEYSAELNKFSGALGKTASSAADDAAKMERGYNSSLGGIKTAWLGLAAGAATAAYGFSKAWAVMEDAAQFDTQKRGLDELASAYGSSADSMLDDIQRVTGGVISRVDAIAAANKGFMLGLDPAHITSFAGAAERLSDVLGSDLKGTYEDLTQAVGLGNEKLLKRMGIMVDFDAAYKRYAASHGVLVASLSEEARQTIRVNEATEIMSGLMQRLGPGVDDADDKIARFNASLSDLKTNVVEKFLPAFTQMAEGFTFMAREAGKFIALFHEPAPTEKIEELNKRIIGVRLELAKLEDMPKSFSDWDFVGPLLAKTRGPQIAELKKSLQGLMADLKTEMDKVVFTPPMPKGGAVIPISLAPEFTSAAWDTAEIQRGLADAQKPLAERLSTNPLKLQLPLSLDWTLLTEAAKMNAELDAIEVERAEREEARLEKMRGVMAEEAALQNERVQTAILGSDIVVAAQQEMSNQMLAMIETGKFSTEEFGRVVVSQVKMTLTGIAARAAVEALYYAALGLGYAAMGMPTLSSLAFSAAAGMAAVSGVALASTAGVQALFGGQTTTPAAGTVGGAPIITTSSPSVPLAPEVATEAAPTQNITVIVNGPLSNQDWDKIAEENIVPAINNALDRDYTLNIRYA